jgi:hypothetical protein
MAISDIGWDGLGAATAGYDLHVLAGESTPPLNDRLVFQRKDAGGNVTNHFASTKSIPPDWAAKPADVDAKFVAEFKADGPQAAGKHAGHGIEVEEATGKVEIAAALPATRLYNFLIKAELTDKADNTPPLSIRIRVHVHESIQKIWLTPRKLIVRSGATNQRFTVLAEFDDGSYGDITGRTDLGFSSSNNAGVVSVDVASGLVTYVAAGTAQITVTGSPSPPDGTDTADVLAQPSLAVERRIERVRPRGMENFMLKTNFLFLPDGFTVGERQTFNDIVEQIVERLQTDVFTYPYSLLKDSINYWRLADADFLASEEESVGVLSQASIVGRKHQQASRLPFPSDPGAAPKWELENMIFRVGLPVWGDRTKDLAAKINDWRKLYDNIQQNDPHISNDVFLKWRALHTRKLLNERCTALGFAIDNHPRVDLDPDRYLELDPRRFAEADFQAMISKLRKGAAPGTGVVGATWTTGKDKGLVCVICRSRRVAGERNPTGLASSLARDDEQPVQAAPAPRRGVDLVTTSRFLPLHSMVPITVAHECAHAFGLGDEYGGGLNYPAHRDADIAENGNIQPASEVRFLSDPISPLFIKWNWPRLTAAGRLTEKPNQREQRDLKLSSSRDISSSSPSGMRSCCEKTNSSGFH